ncbi:tetratricopeptide repeat protein [Nautilia lithotrophica]
MDFRDPLFSVIMFFVIVLISVLITIGLGKLREYSREKKLEEFLKDFEYIKIENLKLDEASIDALYLLAKAYEKEGDFEKSLKIYLWISKNLKSTEILRHIAKLYYKAGFLEKAKKTAYQILSTKPRDTETLKLLILIDEKLDNLNEIVNVLEIFEELEISLTEEKAYALFKLSLKKDCDIEFCKDIKTIEDVYKKYPFIRREYLRELFKTDPAKAYNEIPENNVYGYIDLFWYRNDIPYENKFMNILAAKHLAKCEKKAPFELEVLKQLKENFADLEFEYVCQNCKKIFPLYSTRCPNCHQLFKQKVLFNIIEKKELKDIEF